MASRLTRPSASSRHPPRLRTVWGLSIASVGLSCSLQMPSEGEVFAGDTGSDIGGGAGGGAIGGSAIGAPPGSGGDGGGLAPEPTAGRAAEDPNGLIAHFAFEDATDTAKNEVAGAQNATYHGSRTSPPGVRGKALGLRNADGATSDWVELPEGLISKQAEVTISLWVRDLSTSRSGARLFGFSRSKADDFYFSPDDDRVSRRPGAHLRGSHGVSPFVDLWTETPLTDKSWHHVAVRWSAVRVELFVDGSSAGSGDTKGVKPSDLGSTSSNWLGRNFDDSGSRLFAEIDELRIFGRSLSPSEIAQLHASP